MVQQYVQLEVSDTHYKMPLCVSLSHLSDQTAFNEHNKKKSRICSYTIFTLIIKMIFSSVKLLNKISMSTFQWFKVTTFIHILEVHL